MDQSVPVTRRDLVLFCLAGALGIILWLVQPANHWVTLLALVALTVLLIYPALQFSAVKNAKKGLDKGLSVLTAIVLVVVLVVVFGLMVWPATTYLSLTRKQQKQFIQVLNEIPHPGRRLRIGCSATEDICASVMPWVRLFQRAHWVVRRNQVERGFLGLPESGVTILIRGEGVIPDEDDPKLGLWATVAPEWKCLMRAFKTVGITPHLHADRDLSDAEIVVVFGPAP